MASTTSTPRAGESPKPGPSGTSSSAGKTPKPGKSRARSTCKTPKPGAGTSVLWPYLYMSPTNGLQRHQNNKRGMPLEDWRTSKLWNGNQQAAGRAAAAAGGGSQQGGREPAGKFIVTITIPTKKHQESDHRRSGEICTLNRQAEPAHTPDGGFRVCPVQVSGISHFSRNL